MHGFGGLVDRVVRVERAARPPGVVDHLEVVLLLVVEDVIEPGEGPEDEQDVAGADADELRARRDAGVVATGGGAEPGCDPRDVSAVADRRLAVRQVLDEQVRALLDRLVDRALEREQVTQVEKDLHVLHGLVGVVDVGVV